MDRDQYLSLINAPGINVIGVEWQTEVRPAARHKAHLLQKVSTATVMVGAAYENLSANNDRETGPLPWGEWAEDLFPYVIEHKGKDYFRLNTVDGTVKTIYLVDGMVVRRETLLSYLTPSQRNAARPHAGTVTIKSENLRLVGDVAAA
jgi:hypothetical protein